MGQRGSVTTDLARAGLILGDFSNSMLRFNGDWIGELNILLNRRFNAVLRETCYSSFSSLIPGSITYIRIRLYGSPLIW